MTKTYYISVEHGQFITDYVITGTWIEARDLGRRVAPLGSTVTIEEA